MSWTFTTVFNGGTTGLSDFRAQLLDAAGSAVGSAVSSGFSEIGSSLYQWTYALVPDGHAGAVKFYRVGSPTLIVDAKSVGPVNRVDVGRWLGADVPAPNNAGYPRVDVYYGQGYNLPVVLDGSSQASFRANLMYWLGTAPLALSSQKVQASVAGYAAGMSPAEQVASYPGSGDTPVDHNTGGTDVLRYTTVGGAGIGGADVFAYLKTEWDADPNTAAVRGHAETEDDGRWSAPMMLDHGLTYKIVFQAAGYAAATAQVAV